jgi:hypothetical protein
MIVLIAISIKDSIFLFFEDIKRRLKINRIVTKHGMYKPLIEKKPVIIPDLYKGFPIPKMLARII